MMVHALRMPMRMRASGSGTFDRETVGLEDIDFHRAVRWLRPSLLG